MPEELDWYLSRSGPRATVSAVPDLKAVARAVALWAYDPEQPRAATRAIAQMSRGDVVQAVVSALRQNPLLLSPKKRELDLLPAAADARLVPLARTRIRELYPEIEHVERAAELPLTEREHPAVRTIFVGYYPGSGAGRPRVPASYPRMLLKLEEGLVEVASAARELDREQLTQLREEAWDCSRLCREVMTTCDTLRRRGQELSRQLRAVVDEDAWPRRAGSEADRVDAALADGDLPYANSDILPVSAYGGMQPRWDLHPLVRRFAEDNMRLYEEIDRYGEITMGWAQRIAVRARDILPPPIPSADGGRRSAATGLAIRQTVDVRDEPRSQGRARWRHA